MRTWKLAVVAGVVLSAGVVWAADERAGDPQQRPEKRAAADDAGMDRPDAWITTKVKLALLTDDQVDGLDVNVDTTEGRVTLHGAVDSDAEKQRAAQIASGIAGVKDVRNELTVQPDGRAQARGEVSDDTIEQQVQNALSEDPVLKDSKISVKSVDDRVVTLGGSAASAGDELRAVQNARRVPGVQRVDNEIAAADRLGEDELWDAEREDARGKGPDAAERADADASRSAGTVVTDLWITSAAKMRLAANEQTPARDINVDTYQGVVTLFGTVPNAAAKQAAEAEVKQVDGVAKVDNQLKVVAADAPDTGDSDR